MPNQYQQFINREIDLDFYVELMMGTDKQRMQLSFWEFNKIRFKSMGFPKIILQVFGFFLGVNYLEMMDMKAKQLYKPVYVKSFQNNKFILARLEYFAKLEFEESIAQREMEDNFKKYFNFTVFEQFFRLFSENP